MKELEFIKSFYKPSQPTVKTEKDILYHEIYPDPQIENFIYCFWQLKTTKNLENAFIYNVVSDGCIDIFFNHNDSTENFVMGFCRKYTQFSLGREFDYIGIRFFPTAFPLLFGKNAKSLSNQSLGLQFVLPDFSKWIEAKIKPELSFNSIVGLLNVKLSNHIKKTIPDLDFRFFKALNLILERNGHLDVESDLDTGISPRQLRRIFNYYIGTTPKAFSKVVRFQYILNASSSKQRLKEEKLFFDVGFYDQAHFIKDFKTFYGITPMKAFK